MLFQIGVILLLLGILILVSLLAYQLWPKNKSHMSGKNYESWNE